VDTPQEVRDAQPEKNKRQDLKPILNLPPATGGN
jgi:hypothetical protein